MSGLVDFYHSHHSQQMRMFLRKQALAFLKQRLAGLECTAAGLLQFSM